VAKKYYLL